MRKPRTGYETIGKDYSPTSAARMCFNKRPYATKNAARDAGLKFNQTGYRCPVCHLWHLTSLSSEDGNAARRRAKL